MPRITALRTIRLPERPKLIWVEVETEDGLTGLGETFRGAQAVEAVLHEQTAPAIIGRAAENITSISSELLNPYVGFGSSSAEVRAASAVDIALWDLAGQRAGVPLHVARRGRGTRSRPRLQHLRWLRLQYVTGRPPVHRIC